MKFLIGFLVLMIFPGSSYAIDYATEHTQILNNVELISENLRQLQSLENEAQMIQNQVIGLKSVANFQNSFGGIDDLRNELNSITSQGAALSSQTQNLINQMQQIISQPPTNGNALDQEESLDQNTLNVVQNALNRTAQIRQSYEQAIDSVNDLINKNNTSLGQTQALQTSNELAAQNISQNQSTQELLSEQISMQAAMLNKQLQQEKNADSTMQQIANGASTSASSNTNNPALNQNTNNVLQQVFGIYQGSVLNLQAGSVRIAKEIFYAISLISIAVLGFNLLLRKGGELAETNLQLIQHLIYLIFLYAFISNFGAIYTTVFNWINDTGNYLGLQASHASINKPVMSIDPINIFMIGIGVAEKMLIIPIGWNVGKDLLIIFFAVVSAATVVFCFAVIGLELILVQIGSQIIMAGGVFLLGFAGVSWTRDYAERYVHTFFHVGVKMIFLYILVGIGMSLSKNWYTVLNQTDQSHLIDTYLAVAVASYVYYKLCLKLPDQAVSWLTGRLSMGFDTATDIKAGLKTVAETPKKVEAVAANVVGMGMALGAANQLAKSNLAANGQKATAFNTGIETIKTFGSAMKQERWEPKVADTLGGKMFKNMNSALVDREGDIEARGAANQETISKFYAQDIIPTNQQIHQEVNTTLTQAKNTFQQEAHQKLVDATDGGKIAQNILDSIPKTDPNKAPTEDFQI